MHVSSNRAQTVIDRQETCLLEQRLGVKVHKLLIARTVLFLFVGLCYIRKIDSRRRVFLFLFLFFFTDRV